MRIAIAATSRNTPYEPNPADFLTISEGTPYVVPASTIFVLTGLGYSTITDDAVPSLAELRADGVLEVMGGLYGCSMLGLQTAGWVIPDACSGAQVPDCISFAAGVSLAVTTSGMGNGRAWGYHAPA